ncbi:MAG: hypothetical protein MK102_01580 [Fuerstiella sp.]|nr:hypothetical protein [Fuerstiella sp.]
MEYELEPFNWLLAIGRWGSVTGAIALIAVAIAFVASVRLGPSGLTYFSQGLTDFIRDLLSMSPTRVLAVARLTLKEAIRRKALVVFVVFAVLLMFAGWFMTSGNNRADISVGVQIWFLLTAISWLILPAAMFLSCWSIPEDIRTRSLHTVVTKPIRRIEVVLGRIVGFGGVLAVVVIVMGFAGYIWIQRQVPANIKEQLKCRIPVYGDLIFKDRMGGLAKQGINTGDVWDYRSYIEGNTRARAIWLFNDFDENMLSDVDGDGRGDQLNLESRFESFRTIKGSADSVEQGLEAQFTLVKNVREEAFSVFGFSPEFRQFSTELLAGQFQNASTSLSEIASSITDGAEVLEPSDCKYFYEASRVAIVNMNYLGEGLDEIKDGFEDAGRAANLIKTKDDTAAFDNFSKTCARLSELLAEHSDHLLEVMPRLEVSLPNVRVTEYHKGQDQVPIDRTLTFTADYESLARFLASTITEQNEAKKLVSGESLTEDLARQLADTAGMSILNSELLVDVLQEELDAEILVAQDSMLSMANKISWINYFDQLVRSERLTSQDPEGWRLTADIYDDLVFRNTLRIEVACMNDQMFIGMARPDLFIRLPDNPFAVGYSKALLCTILMLVLVVVIGVTASTIVKGPVALFLTFGVFVIGQVFHGFMSDILAGQIESSGMISSGVLILQQRNPMAGVDVSRQTQNIIESADNVSTSLLYGASRVIPDFGLYSQSAKYVENGFDVPWSTSMLPAILTFFGFLIPCVLLGAAFLKFRELEAK